MATIQELKTQIEAVNALGRTNLAEKGVEVSDSATTYDIMNSIVNIEGVNTSIEYSNIIYNEDDTVTLVETNGTEHIVSCVYNVDGVLTSITYDGKEIYLTFNGEELVGIGDTVVDLSNQGVGDIAIGSRQWWLDTIKDKITFTDMFRGCASITTIPQLDTSKGTTFNYMFGNCTSITTIPQLDTSQGTMFIGMFIYCSNLVTIPLLDVSNGTNFTAMFNYSTKITNIKFVECCIKYSISFQHSPLLSDESIQSIIDGLADLTGGTTQTLTLHADVKAKLTEEQIAQITSKNWTLA